MNVHYVKASWIGSSWYLPRLLRCELMTLLGGQPGSEAVAESWVPSPLVLPDVAMNQLGISGF